MSKREDFLKVARTWEGVPWAKIGYRREGVNCLGLLVGISLELDFLKIMGEVGKAWSSFPKPPWKGAMLQKALEYLELTSPGEIVPGDLILFRLDSEPSHITIVLGINPTTILHSHTPAKKVVVSTIPPGWVPTIAFKIKELDL